MKGYKLQFNSQLCWIVNPIDIGIALRYHVPCLPTESIFLPALARLWSPKLWKAKLLASRWIKMCAMCILPAVSSVCFLSYLWPQNWRTWPLSAALAPEHPIKYKEALHKSLFRQTQRMVEFICQFVCYNFPLVLCRAVNIQLGQANVNPPDLCLKWGGLQLCRHPCLESWSPPTCGTLKWGGLQLSRYGCLQSWSPPTSSTSLGGSRWPDPAVKYSIFVDRYFYLKHYSWNEML